MRIREALGLAAGAAAAVISALTVPEAWRMPLWVVAAVLATLSIWALSARPRATYWGEWVPDRWIWDSTDPSKGALFRVTHLKRAANAAYRKTQESIAAEMAEHPLDHPEARPASWYATALIGGRSDNVSVYGSKPALNRVIRIPSRIVWSGQIAENLDDLIEPGSKRVIFTTIRIARRDLRRRTKEIGAW